ncbi:MAG TPA: sensor histidine kinase N-terminal domain-containing protein, partial [Roseateles sp.]
MPTKDGASPQQGSLFGEILDWMLAPLLLIWPISVALTWLVAQGIASRPYDRELGEMARSLGLQVAAADAPTKGRDRYALAPEAAALLRADASDTVFYQVLGLRGELLSGDATLPVPVEDAPVVPWELHFRDDEVGTDAVRVAYLWVAPEGQAGASKTMLVQV